MFLDIAPSEFLLTAIVAVVVIGPKDLPRAMRTAGKWMGKMRRISGHFRSGLETMIREAELEDMEKKWREQNEAIMKANPPSAHLPAPEVAAHAPSEPLAEPLPQSIDAPHHEVTSSDVTPVETVHHDAPAAPKQDAPPPPPHPEILS
jgi:sec-independent protein translocase protein TatB